MCFSETPVSLGANRPRGRAPPRRRSCGRPCSWCGRTRHRGRRPRWWRRRRRTRTPRGCPGRGRARRRRPRGPRSRPRRRPGACAAPGRRAGPSASGRCRPGSRPQRRRRRPARDRTGCRARSGCPRRSCRGTTRSRRGTGPALGHLVLVGRLGLRRGGDEGVVHPAGHQQPEQQQERCCDAAAAAGRDAADGPANEARDESHQCVLTGSVLLDARRRSRTGRSRPRRRSASSTTRRSLSRLVRG